jgi:hypothetical protein
MPRSMMAASSSGSMLPPHSTRPTFARRSAPAPSAAPPGPAAPAPSTSVFSISSSITMACSMSPSSTSTRSSTSAPINSRVMQPRLAHGDALGDRAGALRMLRALDGVDHGREAAGLHADDLHRGLSARTAVAMPLIRPPPPTATTSVSISGCCAQHLQPMVPWPAITSGSSNGVDEGQALLGRHGQRALARVVEAVAVQHHLGAEAARALDLHGGRVLRHHDHRAQAQALRVVRHTLRMVAGRGGDHAADRLAGSRPAWPACSARRAP